jgi:pyrroloquinoline-quinone synthase
MDLHTTVERHHLLKHPFYQLWIQGQLPKEALQKYTGQYFQLVEHLPRFISTLHTNCGDVVIRQQLIQNLMEEELGTGNGNIPHTELWIDFAEELGVPRSNTENAELLKATKDAVNTIKGFCQSSMAEGAAALYAYESQVPEISIEKIHGLKEFYHMTSEKALRFFEVHKDADIKHRAVWKAMSKRFATTPELEAKALKATDETSKALWRMFDAMYENYVPEDVKMMC